MTNDLTKTDDAPPPWMKKKSVGAALGNLDIRDYTPPRLKLIAATSAELEDEPEARAGCFWLTGAKQNLGDEVLGTMIIVRKSMVLWDPMRETKAPLAIASDGIRWDQGSENATFEVRYPNNPNVYTWKTKRSVAESGLDRFGSSRPEDPRSQPAAATTYSMLWAIKLPDGRTTIAMVINSRSGVKPAKQLFDMQKMRGVDHYFQRYRICSIREKRKQSDSTYFTYRYNFDSLVLDEEEGDAYRRLFEDYLKAGFAFETAITTGEDSVNTPHEDKVEVKRGRGVFEPLHKEDLDDIPF